MARNLVTLAREAEAYAWSVTKPGDWVGLLCAIQDYLAGGARETVCVHQSTKEEGK